MSIDQAQKGKRLTNSSALVDNCVPAWPTTYIPYPNTYSYTTPIGEASQVWAAYENGGSVMVIFPTELEALRYAVGQGMKVQLLSWGEEVHMQLDGEM